MNRKISLKTSALNPFLAAFLFVTIALAHSNQIAAEKTVANQLTSFADLIEAVRPAVVNIAAHAKSQEQNNTGDHPTLESPDQQELEEFMRRFFPPGLQQPPADRRSSRSLGSGFIIDPSGLIVTNDHVIRDADQIEIVLDDGRSFPATVRGRDEKTDLALLEINSTETFPFVEFGDSDDIRAGDWVIAIGNPFGLGGSATTGIISARGRDINSGPYDDYLQIDAAINRGNSGGPLFGTDGTVIGVNTAIYSPTGGSVGIGFAIPSSIVQAVVADLRKTGTVQRSWLGVRIQTVTFELAQSFDLKSARGALVAEVIPGSPAKAAGLEPGDIILKFGGEEILQMRQLPRVVAASKPGTVLDISIWRDGIEVEMTAVLESMPATTDASLAPNNQISPLPLGLTLLPLTDDNRLQFGVDEAAVGLLVTEVDNDSVAAQGGIQVGDVIVRVGRNTVTTQADFERRLEEVKASGRSQIVLLVRRAGQEHFVALPLE